MRFTGYTVAAANSKAYGGGMFLAPDADLADGELDVVMVGEVGKLRFLGNLPKVFKGTHVKEDEVRVFRTPSVTLDANRPFSVYADGEHITELPATVRVLPGALQVVAPPAPA
jgi:diacylglycerol kinase family enzyme